jgi:hypothetical protein
MTKEKKSIEGD